MLRRKTKNYLDLKIEERLIRIQRGGQKVKSQIKCFLASYYYSFSLCDLLKIMNKHAILLILKIVQCFVRLLLVTIGNFAHSSKSTVKPLEYPRKRKVSPLILTSRSNLGLRIEKDSKPPSCSP